MAEELLPDVDTWASNAAWARGLPNRYKIVRFFEESEDREIRACVTLEEAQAHCQDPETSSSTAKSDAAKQRTEEHGRWFDWYKSLMPHKTTPGSISDTVRRLHLAQAPKNRG